MYNNLLRLLPVALISASCLGGDQAQQPETEESTDQLLDRVHLSIDLNFANQYFFRGIVQETEGFIFQPSLELGFDLIENDSYSLGAYLGIWNSFHDQRTGATDTDEFVSSWYEVDFYGGLSLTTGRLTTDLAYTNYASPNGAFGHVDEMILTLAWDDSGWIDNITLAPYVTIAVEIGSAQADGGSGLGTFFAVGIEPSYEFETKSFGTITISAPIEAGFSIDDYYEGATGDESFGYITAGLALSVPLPAPDGFGDWSWNFGVDYLLLGDTTEALNGSNDDEWIVHTGFGFAF